MEVFLKVLTKLDVTTKNISQDLKPNRLMKNTRSLQKILRSIPEKMTTFSEKITKVFFSRKALANYQESSEIFLNASKIVEAAQEDSIILCNKGSKRSSLLC